MTIASEITKLNTNLEAAYTTAEAKGATMPVSENFDNLATCIESIKIQDGTCVDCLPLGHSPGGVLTYARNYNTSSMTKFVSYAGKIETAIFGDYFKYCDTITSFSMPSLVSITGNSLKELFYDSTNPNRWTILAIVNFPSLQTINGAEAMYNAFRQTAITQLNFPELVITTGTSSTEGLCRACSALTSISFPKLTTIGQYSLASCCNGCESLTSASLPLVNSLSAHALRFAFAKTSLTTLSFPSLTSSSFSTGVTNQFTNMLSNVTGCTVHFPSNLQSVIGSWSDVTSGFGGTNTTVLFDLPATS